MSKLIGIIGRWVARNLLSFLLIIAVLVAAGFLQKEIKAYLATRNIVATVEGGRNGFAGHVTVKHKDVDERSR